ncbi:unnamed protein product [Durusdinium trenchii]|uniref:Uncharacterized protein n=1 Tax=Durusdinium trenchii TaxID=1381693 RepID=A0ABP0RZF3_9DINO
MAYEEDAQFKAFGPDTPATRLQEVMTKTLGDSRLVELAHQRAKDIIRTPKQGQFSNTAIMQRILASDILEARKMNTVKVAASTKVQAGTNRTELNSINALMKASTHNLPKSMQAIMLPQGVTSQWPSPTPHGLWQSAAATQWLFNYWPKAGTFPRGVTCNSAWQSILATPGTCVAQRSTASIMRVVASAEFSFLAWEMAVEQSDTGETIYVMKPSRQHLVWKSIVDLDDWAAIPTEPTLANVFQGPVGWRRSGEPMSLPMALCLAGTPITVQQIKDLIVLLGGDPVRGVPSRQHCEDILFQMLFNPEDLQEAKTKAEQYVSAKKPNKDIDSEFSEVLSELGHDENNQQDLKDLKVKRRKARLKRKADEDIIGGKKRKLGALINSVAKRLKAQREGTLHTAAQPPPPPEPEHKGGTPAPKVYRSPEEILAKISPPHCVIGLSFVDHRFNCRYSVEHEVLEGLAYAAPSKTASFAQRRGWQAALQIIHQFCWEKWSLIRADHPLPEGMEEQAPGKVPPEVLEALQPIIDGLPPARVDSKPYEAAGKEVCLKTLPLACIPFDSSCKPCETLPLCL